MQIKTTQVEANYFDNTQHKKSNQEIWEFNCNRKFFPGNTLR
jgi:hypothetical protein